MTPKYQRGMTLKSVECYLILSALAHFNGDRAITAKALKMSWRSIYRKIAQYKRAGFDVTPARKRK